MKNTTNNNLIICSESIRDIVDLEDIQQIDAKDKKIIVELQLSNDVVLLCDFAKMRHEPEGITVYTDLDCIELLFRHKIVKITIKYGKNVVKHFNTDKNHVINILSLKNELNEKLKVSITISGSGILK